MRDEVDVRRDSGDGYRGTVVDAPRHVLRPLIAVRVLCGTDVWLKHRAVERSRTTAPPYLRGVLEDCALGGGGGGDGGLNVHEHSHRVGVQLQAEWVVI